MPLWIFRIATAIVMPAQATQLLHDMAVAHLERLAERVLPAVRDLGAG